MILSQVNLLDFFLFILYYFSTIISLLKQFSESLMGIYLRSFVYPGGLNGWYESGIASFDIGNSKADPSNQFSFKWYNVTYYTPEKYNGSCIGLENGEFSFVDSKNNYLYIFNDPVISQIDISTKNFVLLKKWTLKNKNQDFSGMAYSSKNRKLYVINSDHFGDSIVSISIDDWSQEFLGNFTGLWSSTSSATMDTTSRYYITFTRLYQ